VGGGSRNGYGVVPCSVGYWQKIQSKAHGTAQELWQGLNPITCLDCGQARVGGWERETLLGGWVLDVGKEGFFGDDQDDQDDQDGYRYGVRIFPDECLVNYYSVRSISVTE
jgi:hypothetical protein